MIFQLFQGLFYFKKWQTREVANSGMKLFCEYIIISMNGDCKHLYQLVVNEEYSYLSSDCNIIDPGIEEMMDEKSLEYIGLVVGDELMLNYDFRSDWEFMIKVKKIQNGYYKKDFGVVSGCRIRNIRKCIWDQRFKVYN